MEHEQIREILYAGKIIRSGHFLRASGLHSNKHVQCAHLFADAANAQTVCGLIAERFREENVQLVLSAAVGGILPGYEVSRQLGVRNIYAERIHNALTLRRGFDIEKGTRVLIVEDMISTGRSVRELMELVRSKGGEVVGVSCILDTSVSKVEFNRPYYAVYSEKVETYAEGKCPLCQENKPFDNV